jgi:putative phosphonate metabolism protein
LRYALYFSPAEDHPLTEAAAAWLGREADGGGSFPTPVVPGITEGEVHVLTADPRRYGFHATLKAPFELAEGRTEEDLLVALDDFAARTTAFDIPQLVLDQLGRFFALVPDAVYPELQQFAASVVETFEPFRAPLSKADIARRKPDSLDEAHRANLLRWGYPYVFDQFRFHMTLTAQVPPEQSPAMKAELERRFSAFTQRPLPIDGIALFIEPARGADFTVYRRLALQPASDQRKTAP